MEKEQALITKGLLDRMSELATGLQENDMMEQAQRITLSAWSDGSHAVRAGLVAGQPLVPRECHLRHRMSAEGWIGLSFWGVEIAVMAHDWS